jgi:hypothetical protein
MWRGHFSHFRLTRAFLRAGQSNTSTGGMTDKPIKLAALDTDDLAVISAHLQDAIMRVGDIRWMKKQSKLALAANRYDHLKAGAGTSRGERKLSAMQVSRVNRVSATTSEWMTAVPYCRCWRSPSSQAKRHRKELSC